MLDYLKRILLFSASTPFSAARYNKPASAIYSLAYTTV